MLIGKLGIFLATAGVLAGCSAESRRSYESTPVKIETSEGVVTCQLYTRERVLWDRAIERSSTISAEDANALCVAEGLRLQQLE